MIYLYTLISANFQESHSCLDNDRCLEFFFKASKENDKTTVDYSDGGGGICWWDEGGSKHSGSAVMNFGEYVWI